MAPVRLQCGLPHKPAAQRLGHADPGFTMRVYGHVAEGLQRQATNSFEELMAQGSG